MDIAAFKKARLVEVYSTYGMPAKISGHSCFVCASSHKDNSALHEGGIEIKFERIIRCKISDFPNGIRVGSRAEIDTRIYRIESVMRQEISGEYVLSLVQQK